mmetsp:Transcript_29961/g.41749  ORF Transcript_29961/g.41749 Transcript_29961/m.41749 type:complete len:133 (+) Transcript_29961:456-854(+)
MISIANTIYKKYLATNILGMNVKGSSRNTISKAINCRKYKYDMFATAVHDIECTLSRQSFMRFKRNSKLFKQMMDGINAFKPYAKASWIPASRGLDVVLGEGEGKNSPFRVDVQLRKARRRRSMVSNTTATR